MRSSTALISLCQCATNRSRYLSFYLCAVILLLAVVPAWGSPGRMVMVSTGDGKGSLHRFVFDSANNISYSRGHPNSEWGFVEEITLTTTAGTWPCRTWIPKQGDNGRFAAEGLAVFENKIFVAFTADTDCLNHSAGMSAYVAAFDLRATPEAPYGHWLVLDHDAKNNPLLYKSLGRGSARTNNAAAGWGSGAAITVFNNMLYVFTDAGVYTSGNGTSWSPYAYSFTFSTLHPDDEPLDAVTINTPDGPRILIVYGYISGQHGYYDHLDAVDWIPTEEAFTPPTVPNNPYVYLNFGAPSGGVRARLSLVVGTKGKVTDDPGDTWSAGALAPAVQLFAQTGEEFTTSNHNPARHAEYVYKAAGTASGGAWGTWTWDSDRLKYFDHSNPSLMVYPYSEFVCNDSTSETRKHLALKQRIVLVGGFNWWKTKTPFSIASDYLIPLTLDPTPKCYNDDGTPAIPRGTYNNTADGKDPSHSIMKNYWTLLGVVLGSPPFSDQGLSKEANPDTGQLAALSGVSFERETGSSTESESTMENTASISVGRKVTAGILDRLHISKSFDATYKHTWEKESKNTSTATMTITKDYGTEHEAKDVLGQSGWMLFSAPQVFVQEWKIYAYNYDFNTGAGTPLKFYPNDPTDAGLEIQTLTTYGTPEIEVEYFDLRDPTENNTKPLFSGMGPFSYTNLYDSPYLVGPPPAGKGMRSGETLEFWANPKIGDNYVDWQNDQRWEPRAGEGPNSRSGYVCKDTEHYCRFPLLSTSASKDTQKYTITGESMVSKGQTREIDIQSGHSFGGEAKFDGFSVGSEFDLTLGYDGKFGWKNTTTTSMGTSATVFLSTNRCDDPSCFSRVDVRPYWLNPVSPDAPWIPTAFKDQSPWCLTWKVVCACHSGTCCPCDTSCPAPAASGTALRTGLTATELPSDASGTALPPANAFGRIVSGEGGEDGGEPSSHYVIQGGRMAWGDAEGGEHRIPMTADDFVPSAGINIEVSGISWSSAGNGSWKRNGETWRFQTDPSAKPRVTLNLDFGSATYDLEIQKADLNRRVLAGATNAGLALVINQRYKFYTVLHHNIDVTWRWSQQPPDNVRMHVTSFEGRYNSTLQSGKMSIAGTLPAQLSTFGDLEVNVNDHPYVASLISLDGFQQAFETGGVVKYSRQGATVMVDFGRKTWSASFNNKAFHRLLAPQLGKFRSHILVGGVPWLREEIGILDYSANLTLVH